MKHESMWPADDRIAAALAEFQELIRARYTDAIFAISERNDPPGVYLKAIVDIDDADPIIDLMIDRMLELQIEQEVPVWVLPLRPPARVLASLPRKQRRRPARALLPSAT